MEKKVVLVGTAHPFRGGLASYNERLIKEFVEQGNEASIETFTLQYPNFLFPGKTQYSDSDKPADIFFPEYTQEFILTEGSGVMHDEKTNLDYEFQVWKLK